MAKVTYMFTKVFSLLYYVINPCVHFPMEDDAKMKTIYIKILIVIRFWATFLQENVARIPEAKCLTLNGF